MIPRIAVGATGLEALPERPPTPPREKQTDVDPKHIFSLHPRPSIIAYNTPPNYSPDSATDSTNCSSRRLRKKVEFTVQAEYRDAPNYAGKENVPKESTPTAAPSSTGSKPVKSILKPSSSPNRPNPVDPLSDHGLADQKVNIATMLESTIKQLAGADRDSKLDAYMMLVRALKASTNLPDRVALQEKMSLFMQFMQRDITSRSADGSMDSSLINHALTLLSTLLHFPAIASTVTNDFAVFIVDYSIKSFEDPSVPKDVVRHLMQVIAFQDFSLKVMNSDRVGRLVSSLHEIEEHLKGKSIIMSRILIYRRLVNRQSRIHMVTHSDWLLDLFTDMLSSMKEIRAAAVSLGLETSFTIGKEKQLSRRVMEILQLTMEDTKYIEYFVNRLMAMTKDKNESSAVPQIWSVVILLLRCPIDRWEFFSRWLEIIEKCFNNSDIPTKMEANRAWNRLVYALHVNESSLSKTIGTVCQPFISQLKRRGKDRYSEELRRVVVGSVCNLFYYAFKPNSSSAQTDHYWDDGVRPIMRLLTDSNVEGKTTGTHSIIASENLVQGTVILTWLFNSSTPRLWKDERVAETVLIKPNELPAIDPKWIRRNASRVFSVIEPILAKTFPQLSRQASTVYRLWHTLLGAVAFAASKEVKVSTDTANFMAHAFSLFLRIWAPGRKGSAEATSPSVIEQDFLAAAEIYLTTMINSLGLLPFTERLLSMNKQDNFVTVATPSHRTGKNQGLVRTPLLHLFSILSTLPPEIEDGEGLSRLIKTVISPFITARSARGQKDLAHELMQSMPSDGDCPYGSWACISDLLIPSLESSQSSHSTGDSGSEPPVGHEYRNVVKHLEKGLMSTLNLPWAQWSSLFHLVIARATDETGEAGCAVAIVEPLSKTIIESLAGDDHTRLSSNIVKASIELLSLAKQPRDRQALDAARRRLWGTSVAGSRTTLFDPYANFYKLVERLMETAYTQVDHLDQGEIIVPLLTEVGNFLIRCSRLLVYRTLTHLQGAIGLWIRDENGRFSSRQSPKLYEAVKTLWGRVCSLFEDNHSLNDVQLGAIEPLLCSAFKSKHKHIVTTVSALWNRAFENVEDIQYPETLKSVLVSLQPYVDIVLPGLDSSSNEFDEAAPVFIESQEDLELPVMSSSVQRYEGTPTKVRPLSRRSNTPGSVQLSHPAQRRAESTPDPVHVKSVGRAGTPRLRHDDSQIQFAPIASSSPSDYVMESQVLTDRQREVRERQQENAALFPEIHSSARKAGTGSPSSVSNDLLSKSTRPAEAIEATTPQTNRRFDDYVASTPTPRRGQTAIVDDYHEMTDDIPSSPPEPRRNLLSHMQSQTKSSDRLEDYQLLSSPISGSPAKNESKAGEVQDHLHRQEASAKQEKEGMQTDNEHDASKDLPPENEIQESPTDYGTHAVQKKLVNTIEEAAQAPEMTAPPSAHPPKSEGTPKSDNEIFVDALTSPAPRSPHTLRSSQAKALHAKQTALVAVRPNERSFEVSDGEERSMARLVIELDSRKCDPLPEEPRTPENNEEYESPAFDCITVNTGSSEPRRRSSRGRSRESSPVITPSTPTDGCDLQSSNVSSKAKRKRDADRSVDCSSKKPRHSKYTEAEDIEAVPDSQGAPLDVPSSSPNAESMADDIDLSMEDYRDEYNGDLPPSSPQIPPNDHMEDEELIPAQEKVHSDDNEVHIGDSEAVHLQLMMEASQHSQSGRELRVDQETAKDERQEAAPENAPEEVEITTGAVETWPSPPQTIELVETARAQLSVEKIMASLREGLEGLRTATLKREEVYKIEDMFMDIKRELYEAESRGRQ